jgi:hypothetical protein
MFLVIADLVLVGAAAFILYAAHKIRGPRR